MEVSTGANALRRQRTLWVAAGAIAVAGMVLSSFVGPSGVDDGPLALIRWLAAGESPSGIFIGRLSRVLLGGVVGFALCASGTTLQGLLRNPLADPFIIGVSGAAALGGAVAVAFGSERTPALLVTASVGGAAVATFALAAIMRRPGERDGATTALLVGVVLNAFASALITLIKTMVSATKAQSLLFWLVGTVGYPSWASLAVTAVVVALAFGVLVALSGRLELLRAGDVEAQRLGVDVPRTQFVAYLAASALVGAVVPLTGLIGFIGLVLPHAVRLLIGSDLRILLVTSALVGAGVLPIFDAVSRIAFTLIDTEIPAGALTAVVGAPLFVALLLRRGLK